jgi:superfamily II DNA or RNA helicase
MIDWNLEDREGNILSPRTISGKNQAEIVNKVVELFETKKIVILTAPAGFGKSAIALNVAKNYDTKFSMVVPTKILQKQMTDDYSGQNPNKIVKKNGRNLKLTEYKGTRGYLKKDIQEALTQESYEEFITWLSGQTVALTEEEEELIYDYDFDRWRFYQDEKTLWR